MRLSLSLSLSLPPNAALRRRCQSKQKNHFHHSGTSVAHIKLTTPHHAHTPRRRRRKQTILHKYAYASIALAILLLPCYIPASIRCLYIRSRALHSTHTDTPIDNNDDDATRHIVGAHHSLEKLDAPQPPLAPHRHWTALQNGGHRRFTCYCLHIWPCHV